MLARRSRIGWCCARMHPGTREFLRACVDYDNIPADSATDFNLTVQRVRTQGTREGGGSGDIPQSVDRARVGAGYLPQGARRDPHWWNSRAAFRRSGPIARWIRRAASPRLRAIRILTATTARRSPTTI